MRPLDGSCGLTTVKASTSSLLTGEMNVSGWKRMFEHQTVWGILALGFGLIVLSPSAWAEAPPAVAIQTVAPFSLKDYRGAEIQSTDFADSKCLVVAFLGTECPLAKLYGPRLQQLSSEYEGKSVQFIAINSNQQDSISDIAAYVKQHHLTYPILKDPANQVADQFRAERTPEVFILNPLGQVLYRGRIDDQYIVGVQRDAPQREDLRLALDEILADRPVSITRTDPIGCLIGRVRTPQADATVTWANQISRIAQKHCVECHRPGEIGPFSMVNYEDVFGWGDMIAEVVSQRRMPPWHADPRFGKFVNDCSLSSEDRDLILAWVHAGCPQGDTAQQPVPLEFTQGWQLSREPDAVFEMRKKPFEIPASAGPEGVAYQNFAVDPKFKTDKWICEMEVVPGNRAVVHHIIVYVQPEGKRQKGDGEFLCAYVPGTRARPLAVGHAKKIKAGSWLRFQVHYTPNGSPQSDLSKVGLIFTEASSVTHQVLTMEVHNTDFQLAPGEDNQSVTAHSNPSPVEVQLLSMAPHMHLRGKSFKYELEMPDGTRQTILDVPRYDFNWQTNYRLAEPLIIPAGARLHCTAVYDNSANNPANPDPTKTITWGDQSWDEMMLGYFDVLVSREILNKKIRPEDVTPELILKQFDKDSDGKISQKESQGHPILVKGFPLLDTDRDKSLDRNEIEKAIGMIRKALK